MAEHSTLNRLVVGSIPTASTNFSSHANQAPRRYLAWLAATFAALYLLPFFLLKLPSIESWCGSGFGPALEYGFTLQGDNADIVLFGDSTAAVDIDPRLLSAELGLKAVNLPNTGASLHVLGDTNLQRYLQHNRPPRLIVLMLAPWNLDFLHEPAGSRIYEGEEMLVRHGSLPDLKRFVRRYPGDSLMFPFRFYASNPPAALRSLLRGQHPARDVAEARGYADPLWHRPPLAGPCRMPLDQVRAHPADTVAALLQKYRAPGTDIMVYLPPLPACDNVGPLQARSYAQIDAAPVRFLPVDQFKMDFAFAHLLPSGVPAETHQLAAAVRNRLNKDGNADAPKVK